MVTFLKRTFGASGQHQAARPSEIRIGDSIVMVSGDALRGAMPACLYVYVDDVDSTYRRALKAGATSLEAPEVMPYGDRRCMVEDEWGNLWQIATLGAPAPRPVAKDVKRSPVRTKRVSAKGRPRAR